MSTININVSKADMGLDQVDNTSDLNKPISTATQTALNNIDLQSVTDIGNTTTDNIAFTGAVGVLLDNTSTLRKGTIDAGYGGAKGIAQICSVGYELKWEAGRLYVMGDGGTTIREVSHNFTTTPSATDDNTKGFIIGSRWILDNGDLYVCTDVTTATAVWVLQTIDASPTDGSTKAVSSNGVFDALALKVDKVVGSRLITSAEATLLGNTSGTNTGDETVTTIKTKLGITTLSGSNTGDETITTIKTKLGITTLSGSNTGDQDLTPYATKATPTFTGLTTLDTVKVTTGNYIIPVDVVGIDAVGNVNRVSASNGRTALGLGSLATQSGTFSGTSSGTNTGDQTISDATITTTDITTNNFTTAKHGFVPKGTNVGNYLKDDGTWSTISAGGLTYFTEAQSTASPNATVNVDSLTAIASTTNADFVIKPKGTGSILASIPDDTTTGGNKRGLQCTDLQTKRTAATQVATGNYGVIGGGYGNQITSGEGSTIAGGYGCTITGAYAFATGLANTVGLRGFAAGISNTITGSANSSLGDANTITNGGASFAAGNNITISSSFYAAATGRDHTVSGSDTFTAGYLHTNNGQGSAVFGARGSANSTMTRLVIGTKGFVAGGSQASRFVSGARTTNAVAKILVAFFEDDATSQSYNQLVLANNSSVRFKGTIIGRQSGSTNTSAWDIDGIIQRGTTAGSTTLLISNVNVVQNTPAWGTPTLAANTGFGCLTVNVTGAATTNIQWTCSLDTTEVIYA